MSDIISTQKKSHLPLIVAACLVVVFCFVALVFYGLAQLASIGNIDTGAPRIYDQVYFAFVALSVFFVLAAIYTLFRFVKTLRARRNQ